MPWNVMNFHEFACRPTKLLSLSSSLPSCHWWTTLALGPGGCWRRCSSPSPCPPAWRKHLISWTTDCSVICSLGQTPHHHLPKLLFFTVPSIFDWQKCVPVEHQAGRQAFMSVGVARNRKKRSSVAGGAAFDIHLQTIEYSLQVKYKGSDLATIEKA